MTHRELTTLLRRGVRSALGCNKGKPEMKLLHYFICREQIDCGFVGVIGAFEVYRGKARGHRMANLRLILR